MNEFGESVSLSPQKNEGRIPEAGFSGGVENAFGLPAGLGHPAQPNAGVAFPTTSKTVAAQGTAGGRQPG
jgi:hypothetical protein